ncbi:endolytic transglycosylase MltG [soil metagenome]
MAEDWDNDDRAHPVAVGPPRYRLSRAARMRAQRRRKRRRTVGAVAVVVLVAVGVATVFLGSRLWHGMFGSPSDYTGDGGNDVVIQVHDGDSTTTIAQTLLDHEVVATVKGFVEAAQGSAAIQSIQPGFYKVRTEIPAASAVERLADPANRVGKLTIPEGRQLDDIADVKTNDVTAGIFSLISQATCVDLDGKSSCVSVDNLRVAAGAGTPESLRVPQWAIEPVTKMGTDHRRIEGLIAPGTWNVDPAASPADTLSSLIAASATKYETGGLLTTAATMNMSPYNILVVASLVQREAKPEDFTKVARVIYNRLNERRKLEFDSTVNYPLDRQEVATTDGDRGQTTPWNTYASEGLPVTPICSPGDQALAAAERPEPGDWLYFVTIDLQGTTLFTRDYEQHLANIELAKRNGVLDSAR